MDRYIALIRKEPDSEFGIEFPDVPGCFSAGRDLNEARALAAEALRGHLELLAEDGKDAPVARSAAAIMAFLANEGLGEDFHGLLEIEAESLAERVVRVNVTFEQSLLERIDQQASAKHMTRSGYLAALARADGSSATARDTERSRSRPRV